MAISKPKISTLVAGQLPEFVRNDHQTFIAFIEAYYEYLESNILLDLNKANDIDTTLNSFIQYFKNEVAINFPYTLMDDRFLLPKLKELYISKGTISSYELLFRILYNKEITIKQPSTQMLRVSDGKWVQVISIFVRLDVGNLESIVGKIANIVSTDRNNQKKIKVIVDRYTNTSVAGVYEVFLNQGFTGTFVAGDLLNYGTTVSGTIVNTTSSLTITQRGKDFKIGQYYDISGTGTGSKIRVNSIDSFGGITSAQFTNYGTGYTSSFNASILALDNQNVSPSNYAQFAINLGPYAKYPGYYSNSDGFLNSDMCIQDSKYYQIFSYAIEIDELFDNYKTIVKNLIHPTGTEVFGEYNININLDLTKVVSLTMLENSFGIITNTGSQLTNEAGDLIIFII